MMDGFRFYYGCLGQRTESVEEDGGTECGDQLRHSEQYAVPDDREPIH